MSLWTAFSIDSSCINDETSEFSDDDEVSSAFMLFTELDSLTGSNFCNLEDASPS